MEVTCQVLAYAEYERTLVDDPPNIISMAWEADYPDPESFLRDGFFPEEVGWCNGEFDRLVETARQVINQSRRMKLYAQADRTLLEDAVMLPLLYDRRQRLIKPWVSKYGVVWRSGAGWKDVVIEPH